MRKLITGFIAAAVLVPAALAVEPAAQTPSQQCKALQTTMKADFAKVYKTFGACVSKQTTQADTAAKNAAKQCDAERNMPEADYKAANGGMTFAQRYGKNENDKNAYGKCVSSKRTSAVVAQQTAELKAAKACKAMRTQKAAEFVAKYGTGKNAYGKCVAALAKAS